MSRPVRPPILPNVFLAPVAAPETMFPADEVTFVKPSEALDTVPEAESFALVAASDAVFVTVVVVDADRKLLRRSNVRDCRRAE